MNPMAVLTTLLTYGKASTIRSILWIIATLLGSHGVTSAQANNFAEATWPLISAAVLAIGNSIWSSYEKKNLHQAEPPSKD